MRDTSESSGQPVPADAREICGYQVLGELRPGESFLAVAPGGRRVVLKAIDPDCLEADGRLHPLIRDRLGRVRELAHARVANLHGVERESAGPGLSGAAAQAWLVWEYVEGVPLEQWVEGGQGSPRELLLVVRELVLLVEALHARGIVHGAIHGGNVILGPELQVRLTHVSPLLYDQPAQDADDVVNLLREVCQIRGAAAAALGEAIEVPASTALDHVAPVDGAAALRQLGRQLAALLEAPNARPRREDDRRADRRRRRLGWLAVAVTLVFVAALGASIWSYVACLTPGPPAPPEAPPAAVQP